jgi:hypothetical protein
MLLLLRSLLASQGSGVSAAVAGALDAVGGSLQAAVGVAAVAVGSLGAVQGGATAQLRVASQLQAPLQEIAGQASASAPVAGGIGGQLAAVGGAIAGQAGGAPPAVFTADGPLRVGLPTIIDPIERVGGPVAQAPAPVGLAQLNDTPQARIGGRALQRGTTRIG